MSNVYQLIDLFYEKRQNAAAIYKKNKIERYFREQAWAGKSEKEQKYCWSIIGSVLDYLCQNDFTNFIEMSPINLQEIYFIFADDGRTGLTEENVRDFFDVLEDFAYYFDRNNKESVYTLQDLLEETREAYYVKDKFTMPDRQLVREQAGCLNAMNDFEDTDYLNEMLNKLLTRMGCYFQLEEYKKDLELALFQFVGPVMEIQINETFMATFWDYFFFDFHLIKNGKTPVKYYYTKFKELVTEKERQLLLSMINAKFTVFTITGVVEDIVFCKNLLTDEEFDLPYPDNDIGDYKKLIFFGHMQVNDILMLNYVTATPASPRLCKRIQSEILNIYEIYKKYQQPDATIEDFLEKHSAAVRHTIFMLSSFAKLNVINSVIPQPELLKVSGNYLKENTINELDYAAQKLFLSQENTKIIKRLCNDYLALDRNFDQENDYRLLVAGTIYLFVKINKCNAIGKYNGIMRHLKVKNQEAADFGDLMEKKLGGAPLDPRYLGTEGFVMALYADEMDRSDKK